MCYLGLPLSLTHLRRVDVQPLEDKIAGKCMNGTWKNANMAGRRVLVRSVLTSQAIYHLTSLDLPMEVISRIKSLLRAYLWAGCDKVTGGKCKVNWETVCRPTKLGGLGIVHLEKFASALRLRWLWLQWVDKTKAWIGLGNPCNKHDRELFAAATVVTVGDGEMATFWKSSWLLGAQNIRTIQEEELYG